MSSLLIAVFVITYAAIAFEHPLKVNKSASALLGAGILWAIYAMSSNDLHLLREEMSETLVATAQIRCCYLENQYKKTNCLVMDSLLGYFFLERHLGQLDNCNRNGFAFKKTT